MSQRFVGFITTQKGSVEILPKAFGLRCRADQRRLVLEMLNSYLPAAARFGKREKAACDRQDLYHICFDKLLELSDETDYTALRSFSALFSRDGRFELRLNLDSAFLRLVYRRILIKHPAGAVSIHRDHITIDNGVRTIVRPVWKHTHAADTRRQHKLIQEGIERFRKVRHDQLYLVYPKNDHFTRHILVDDRSGGREGDRAMKLIPYSFSFCSSLQFKGNTSCA